MAKTKITQKELDALDTRRRAAHLARSKRTLRGLLSNAEGMKRVRGIDAGAWERAEGEDNAQTSTPPGNP